jgi:glutathione S-transferase
MASRRSRADPLLSATEKRAANRSVVASRAEVWAAKHLSVNSLSVRSPWTAYALQSRGEAAYTDAMREALEGEMRGEIDDLEALLGSDARPFIAGAAYSLADCMWTAILARLSLVGLAGWWADGRRASVGAYFDRIRARPSYAMAGVPHERLRRPG